MTVDISALAGAGWQFFDSNGTPLSGGKLYVYAAGTTTPATTYTSSSGTTPNTNPIILNSAGRPPAQVWLSSNTTYKFVLEDASGTVIWTMDNIPGIPAFNTTLFVNLPTLPASANSVVYVTDSGRAGVFICRAGTAPSDPLKGIYVASDTPNFYWERVWDGVNGRPEWFGAVTNNSSGAIPASNLAALNACEALCPVVQLAAASYYINDTWWINTPHVVVQGSNPAIEDSVGTMIVQTDLSKTVIRIGGTSAPSGLANLIFVRNIGVKWNGALTPPSAGNEINAPRGFDIRYNLACDLEYLFAYDALVGHYFYGNVNSKSRYAGCTRSTLYGTNDFFRGVWVGGGATIWAGQNASLFISDLNATLIGAAASASVSTLPSIGLLADGDFADLYIDGFETSQVGQPLHLNGTGGTYSGGHGDVFVSRIVFDQCKADGCIRVQNVNSLAKIQFLSGYLQFNNTSTQNRGVWLEDGGGSITFDNMQILGGGDSRGVYVKNQTNAIFSENVIVEGPGYPVTFDTGSKNATFTGLILDGGNSSGGTRAAISTIAAVGVYIAPIIMGGAGSFSEGINFIGSAHTSAYADPTRVDGGAIASDRKTAINSVKITAPGYYTSAGVSGTSGAGIYVTGITV